MALLAALVIFTVIARYCFSLSWKQLAEFNTTLFAFTTFWGMGINVIKDEHVMIDIIYDGATFFSRYSNSSLSPRQQCFIVSARPLESCFSGRVFHVSISRYTFLG